MQSESRNLPKIYDIAIIGGGASGLMAALAAARAGGKVALIETTDSLGHKILATGNGRCNFTNVNPTDQYHNQEFAALIVERFDYACIANIFTELGLLFDADARGWVYPRTRFAGSVRDVLLKAVAETSIDTYLFTNLQGITKADFWQLNIGEPGDDLLARSLILACAKPLTLSDMPDITQKPATPILGAFKVNSKLLKLVDGVRARCNVKILGSNARFSESGEVLFRKNGLSGIVIFNASRYANVGDVIALDLFAELSLDDLTRILSRRFAQSAESDNLFAGLLHPKLAKLIQKSSVLEPRKLALRLKQLEFTVDALPDAQTAQVTRGGYNVDEFNNSDLMSKRHAGIFACGECLDVDGPCGGYNLHWAWASGLLAGQSATQWAQNH